MAMYELVSLSVLGFLALVEASYGLKPFFWNDWFFCHLCFFNKVHLCGEIGESVAILSELYPSLVPPSHPLLTPMIIKWKGLECTSVKASLQASF